MERFEKIEMKIPAKAEYVAIIRLTMVVLRIEWALLMTI